MRRSKPEVANGIGNWSTCIDVLGKVAIITNCAQLIFTSLTMQYHFTYDRWNPFLESHEKHLHGGNFDAWINYSLDWDMVYFVFMIVGLEHGILVIKLIIEFLMGSESYLVLHGRRDRKLLLNSFLNLSKEVYKNTGKQNEAVFINNDRDSSGKFISQKTHKFISNA